MRQLQRTRVRGDGFVQQLLVAIGNTQGEIGLGELCLQTKARCLKICGGSLRACFTRLHRPSYLSPHVDFPIDRQSQRIKRLRNAALPRPGCVDIGADRWIEARARLLHQRLRLPIIRFGHAQALIRSGNAFLEHIQVPISVDFPPLPARRAVGRLRGFGRRHLLVRGGRFCSRPNVVGSDGAAGARQHNGCADEDHRRIEPRTHD